MMTDPIGDMLTRIRNGQKAGREVVEVSSSRVKLMIAEILKAEGYLANVEKRDGMPAMLILTLKYDGRRGAIQQIKRESTPGHRMYRKGEELPKVLNGYGIAIVSTSRGIMTNKDARKLGVGGEVICSVY